MGPDESGPTNELSNLPTEIVANDLVDLAEILDA